MKAWLTQVKREFWEHQTLFIFTPLVIAALFICAGIYIVTLHASLESEIGMGLFGDVYHLDVGPGIKTGNNGAITDGNPEDAVEYIIDFSRGELVVAQHSESGISGSDEGDKGVNSALHDVNFLFMVIIGFVLVFYLLNCLYADRKDRSILFWKSMPVSEHRNVAAKLIIVSLAAPALVTVISWMVQICFLVFSWIFIYRVGYDPREVVWPQVNILPVFFEQLKFFLWSMAWWLPLNAWLLFSSALGKRSPFLVATIPFVVIIIMEKLLFGTRYVLGLLLSHMSAVQFQLGNLMGESGGSVSGGSIDILLDNPAMLAGFVIAGLLFPATVWLRNHRFEI
jgi:ABC-2 type transport system permease protein